MAVLENIFLLSGAVALFLFGLKTLSSGVADLAGEKLKGMVRKATRNRFFAVGTGVVTTAIAQSSVATNMVVITFVEKGALTFLSACAVVMGTNIGTTVTAQLVSLSSVSDFAISAIGSLVAFIGFVVSLSKKKANQALGSVMLGFGFIFIGIELLTETVQHFKNYPFFTGLFLVENPLLLLLNGFLVTAILQSSSVVTSVMTVLASIGLLDFRCATFIILGANIGTCLPVIFTSLSMSKESVKTAIFNIAFNIFGTLIFFLPLVFFGSQITSLPIFACESGRAIANFHTAFNVAVCIVLLPILKPFCSICERIVDFLFYDKKVQSEKNLYKKNNAKLQKKW